MINPDRTTDSPTGETGFWSRFLADTALRHCDNLEKLLIGCEMIAILDDLTTLEA